MNKLIMANKICLVLVLPLIYKLYVLSPRQEMFASASLGPYWDIPDKSRWPAIYLLLFTIASCFVFGLLTTVRTIKCDNGSVLANIASLLSAAFCLISLLSNIHATTYPVQGYIRVASDSNIAACNALTTLGCLAGLMLYIIAVLLCRNTFKKEGTIMIKYCDRCGRETVFLVVEREESYLVQGEDICIPTKVWRCKDCGLELFDDKLTGTALRQVFDEYRRRKSVSLEKT